MKTSMLWYLLLISIPRCGLAEANSCFMFAKKPFIFFSE